jgi:hypothetical protein
MSWDVASASILTGIMLSAADHQQQATDSCAYTLPPVVKAMSALMAFPPFCTFRTTRFKQGIDNRRLD